MQSVHVKRGAGDRLSFASPSHCFRGARHTLLGACGISRVLYMYTLMEA